MTQKALAYIRGSEPYRSINGKAWLLFAPGGCEVEVELDGLHLSGPCALRLCNAPLCEPDSQHSPHTTELPRVTVDGAEARLKFYIEHLTIDDAVGRTIVLHEGPDSSIHHIAACGLVRKYVV